MPPDRKLRTLIAVTVVFSLLSGLGLLSAVSHQRYVLQIHDHEITQINLFSRKELRLDQVTSAKWRGLSTGTLVLRSPAARMTIWLHGYPRRERQELIRYFRESLPESVQHGWEAFYRLYVRTHYARTTKPSNLGESESRELREIGFRVRHLRLMMWTVVAIWSVLAALVLIDQGDPIWPIWSMNPVVPLVWFIGFLAVFLIFGRLQAADAKRHEKLESEAAGRVPAELLGEEDKLRAAYGFIDDAALAEVIRILEQFLQGEASAKELRHNLEELWTSLQDLWVNNLTHPIGQDLVFPNFRRADSRRRFCDLLNRTRLALTARLPLYYRMESSYVPWVAFTAIPAPTIFVASLIGFGLSLPFALAWLLNALTLLAIQRYRRAAGRICRKTVPWMPFESEEEFQEILAEHPSVEMLACDAELTADRQHWSTANWRRDFVSKAIWAIFSPLALLFVVWLPVTRIHGITRVRPEPKGSSQETEEGKQHTLHMQD